MVVSGKSYIMAFEKVRGLGVALMTYIPEDIVLQPLHGYEVWFRILMATAVVIIIFFAYWAYLFLQRPLQRLIRAFRKISVGQFDFQLLTRDKNEIHYLYEQFNQMVNTIQSLIRDVYEQNIRWQRAELRQLQAQMNPHFLYNTYYRLHRLAQDEDTDSIKQYSKLLGDYLKYIARNAHDDATLGTETDHAKTYVDIQKMRFRDKIKLEWDPLQNRVKELKVPRLMLQPIVENAFNYGLEDMDEQGILKFTATVFEDRLSLFIEDNGRELTDMKLNTLRQRLLSDEDNIETTGLLNVHRRLQLKFGKSFGINLSRSDLGGLKVEIVIPCEEKEEAHVPPIDRR